MTVFWRGQLSKYSKQTNYTSPGKSVYDIYFESEKADLWSSAVIKMLYVMSWYVAAY